jgi:cystathionine beta-lyase
MFGKEGEQHMRLNVGTTRAVLHQALEQLKEAVNEIKNR